MKKKGSFTTILLILIFVAGLSLLLYPSFANYWNSLHASKAIATYADAVAKLEDDEFGRMWQEAIEYNNDLNSRTNEYVLSPEEKARYESVLNIGGSGVMGYIEIESIDVSLPIYHGTSDGVLQVAVGHLDWTNLPIGGTSTHCVLSGHRGLPSAKLFTDLDDLKEGDTFTLDILDEVLTYEVDQIRIVLPSEVSNLVVVDGKDYCTLVTCTPYGINTHRLLVRGHRIETEHIGTVRVVSEAVVVDPLIIAPIVAIPMVLGLVGIVLTRNPKKKRKMNL